jgi:DIE2/ALG10 family
VTSSRLIVLVVFLVVWGLITHGTYAGSGDEPHYLMVAQSIAFDGDFDVENNYAQRDNLIGAGELQPELHVRRGRGGVMRPIHDIGLPLLSAPYVRVAYPFAEWLAAHLPQTLMQAARLTAPLIFRHLISLAMALLTGLLGVQLFAIFARTAESERQAVRWALLLTLSPPLLSHSFLFFTEIPSALLVAWLVKVLSDASAFAGLRQDRRDERMPALVGLAIGLLLLIHVRNIALVLVFVVWAVMRFRRRRLSPASWAMFAMGVAVLLAVRTVTVYTFWGTFVTTPIARPDLSMSVFDALREAVARAIGLLFSRDYGLLWLAPVYLLAIVGLRLIRSTPWLDARMTWALLIAYLVTLLIPYANPYGVAGGFAPASRMIVPIVPLLAVAVFAAARALPMPTRLLVVLQIAIDVFVWQWPKTLWRGE